MSPDLYSSTTYRTHIIAPAIYILIIWTTSSFRLVWVCVVIVMCVCVCCIIEGITNYIGLSASRWRARKFLSGACAQMFPCRNRIHTSLSYIWLWPHNHCDAGTFRTYIYKWKHAFTIITHKYTVWECRWVIYDVWLWVTDNPNNQGPCL